MTTKPRVLAINGSPRGRDSNTDRLLQPLLEGMRVAGAVTETVYAVDLNVNDCLGCFSCWKKTPGRCVFDDDMPALLEKMRGVEIMVWATPLYHFGMTARLKKVMERTLPLLKPYIVRRGEHYTHPPRYDNLPARTLLLSNCGFPERHHFTALLEHFKCLHQACPDSFAGAIFCTAGEFLKYAPPGSVSWYIGAVKQAGQELVQHGRILPETRVVLEKDLVPLEVFLPVANSSWHVEGEMPPSIEEAKGER